MNEGQPQQWKVTVDHVPGQGWEAHIEGPGVEDTLTWENNGPHCLMFDVGAFMADHAARPERAEAPTH